jgi:sporulation protein YlmC with PRC-barrel domain
MGKLPIAVVAALGLMAASASAQMTPAPSQPRTPGSPPATAAAAKPAPTPNPLAQEDVSRIEGTAVYGNDDKKIGRISNVLMNPGEKKIDRLVVNAGGMLGIGGHRVAIPVDQFSWDGDKDAFKLSTTETALKDQPEWVEGEQTMSGSSIPPKSETAPSDAGK